MASGAALKNVPGSLDATATAAERPLANAECREVLRYWLALLRAEEALTQRPVARQPPPDERAINVEEPLRGHDYVKLDFASSARLLVKQRSAVELELRGEVAAFFEDWLAEQYQNGEDSTLPLVGFPTFLLPRGELATLLRFDASIEFLSAEGHRYRAASRDERRGRGGKGPKKPGPAKLRVAAAARGAGSPGSALWVDLRLLSRVLHVEADLVDALAETLRDGTAGEALVAAVIDTVRAQNERDAPGGAPCVPEGSDAPAVTEQGLLVRLAEVCRQRLVASAARERVFDVGLLVNTRKSRTTFHVQRDIERALEASFEHPFDDLTPLGRFLGGYPRPLGKQACRACVDSAGLSTSQRSVAAAALGSVLCPVLGPPGTGKTTVIRNLVGHALVEQFQAVAGNAEGQVYPSALPMLVTSTNNRAVDNAIEPFTDEELPVALRVGSREVTERVTLPALRRVMSWLQAAAQPSDAEWVLAVERYRAALSPVRERLEPFDARWTAEARLAELEQCAPEPSEVDSSLSALTPSDTEPRALRQAAAEALELARRLTELSRLTERETAPIRLRAHFNRSVAENYARLGTALGRDIEIPSPPPELADADKEREAWEDTAEAALAWILDLQLALANALQTQAESRGRAAVGDELERVRESLAEQAPDESHLADQEPQRKLYAEALRLRSTWARKHKPELIEALQATIKAVETSRSLRPIIERQKDAASWVFRLFPIWSCTLLSLGNHFPPGNKTFGHVIIDEAAQCHPAYLVSALQRAHKAAVFGDIFQLEPVVALSQVDERRVASQLRLKIAAARLEPFRIFEGSGVSGQSVANRAAATLPVLRDHFRCQTEIISICDRLCGYGLTTHTPKASARATAPELSAPVLFCPVSGIQERVAGSWANGAEADVAIRWIVRLLDAGITAEEIGLITPFRGQLELLFERLRRHKIPVSVSQSEPAGEGAAGEARARIALGTVHRFQGGERRIILFSTTVRDARSRSFLDGSVNLVNVAVSRAREHLITLGDSQVLLEGRFSSELVQNATSLPAPRA